MDGLGYSTFLDHFFRDIMRNGIILLMCALLAGCDKQPLIKYLSELELIPSHDYSFRLDAPFIVQINKDIVTVPRGFITDLASTPRLLWPLYAPNDTRTIRPAVLHDYMYRCQSGYSRAAADRIFYYGLKKFNVGYWRSHKYYWGVRLFGWMFYSPKLCL